MKKLLYSTMTIFYLSFSMSYFSYAQDCIPTVFTYQEADYATKFTLISTTDGGYLFTGSVNTEAGDRDLYIMRIGATGNLLWSKNYGGTEDDIGKNSKQTPDGGFIIVGQTESFSASGDKEAWIIKTDGAGNEEWSQRYDAIEANDVEVLSNGKYVVVGTKIVNPLVNLTFWMAQIDGLGNIEMEEFYFAENSETNSDNPFLNCSGISLEVLEDGSYLLVGRAEPEFEFYPPPSYSYTIKTNQSFEVEWENLYGGFSFYPYSVRGNVGILHSNGFYYSGGYSECACTFPNEPFIQKIDQNGTVIWTLDYTWSSSFFELNSIRETDDGNLIVAGNNTIVKIDTSGLILWSSANVSGGFATTSQIIETPENGFAVLASRSGVIGEGTKELNLYFLDSLGNNCENRVTGRVYRDNNADCEFNPEEDDLFPDARVFRSPFNLNYSNLPSSVSTNLEGNYVLRVDTGLVEIAANIGPYLEQDIWDLSCPDSTYTFVFSDVQLEEDLVDFAFSPIVSCPLLEVKSTFAQVRPFVASNLFVSVTNIGTEDALNIDVDVEIPDLIVPNVTDIEWPYIQTGNIFTFTIDIVPWGEQKMITIPYITADAAMIGDTVCVRSQIFKDTICSEFIGQGSHLRCRPVTNSFDPNNKVLDLTSGEACLEANDEKLYYTINFQNTGNDTAYQVVITDSLSNLLDLNTFELLSSSHDVQYRFGGERSLIFTFSDINLLDSLTNEQESQGYVEFSVFPTADFTLEQFIPNRAQIYFDYNEPIVTEYAYAYACTEHLFTEITNVNYDFTCGDDYGNLSILAFHPEPLLYSIDNGINWQSSPLFSNLLPVEYDICIKTVNETIIHAADSLSNFSLYNTPAIISVSSTNLTSMNSLDGEIVINAMGELTMEYSIDNGMNWQMANVFSDLATGEYQPIVRYLNGFCTVEGDLVSLTFTSSNQDREKTSEIFQIKPNPFENNFLIECQDCNLSDFNFKVTDTTGRIVIAKNRQNSTTLVETENWQKGVYFIYLKNENGYSVQKIVKQ